MTGRRWLIVFGVALALFAGLIAISVMLPPNPDRLPNSISNPGPNGDMALAQVLGSQGVQVHQVTSLDEAAQAAAGSTLAITLTQELSEQALSRLRTVDADLVIIYAAEDPIEAVAELSDGKIGTTYWWSEDEPRAGCTDPDALAAKQITTSDQGLYAIGQQVSLCFLDEVGNGLYAQVDVPGHRVTVIAGTRWLRNDTITQVGNAALALRALGRHSQLTWYLPGPEVLLTDTAGDELDPSALLPPWFGPVSALFGLALAAAAAWRGRRFGPLVAERLPVAMPASEVSSGLGRLYRQAGARSHSTAALRAASLHRLGARLGLPPAASAELVIERLSRASGEDPQLIRTLYYGTFPHTDSELVALATQLSDLEAKVTSHE
ncbi:hypothetical protein ATK74_2237 [Propionicimonas paludicola]|uniref:DUF4350 domain-containing protein n=1 Tax=Propionicimonas paludicola TaxID=185243 RepID=A0A2A9CTA1_9ACTN|nr:DUF4350 domain-containing protein [Propionicimonas paludicola]PFG17664.1 hypothetical protein ATK74_2237 [Propionicimonas paludicola]